MRCPALLLLIAASQLPAQSEAPLELTRLSGPIVVDGVPNEAAWLQVPALPLTLLTPVFRGTPTQRSEIRVAYDDENFYAAGWFFDTDPSSIRINSLYRDRWSGDDAFALYIDAFNDDRNSKWFGVTAGGVRFDLLISDDGATTNGSWDTFWTAKTTVTSEGWFMEVRIPFSSLGFQADANGRATMGLMATRLVSRLEERVIFPAIDPKTDFRRPSVARDVVLRDVHSRKPVYVTPYVLTGRSRNEVRLGAAGYRTDRVTSREIGADLRYPVTSKLTLDLTANTDFAQVEADDQQVNLDRFPLFFPERRRFFQEGSGLFDFTAGGNARLFNSRRIGLTPGGTPLPVFGGARLVGTIGAWEAGLLEMQTRADGASPSENFGVLRLRRSVLNQWSTAGLMATSYYGGKRSNVAIGSDAVLRPFGDHYLTMKWAGTKDEADTGRIGIADRSLFDARWERRRGSGLAYSLTSTRAGADYRPELGFMQRRDYTTANFLANWYVFTNSSKRFRRVYPGALAFTTYRNATGVQESGTYAFWLQWDTKAGGGGWLEPKFYHENVLAPFTIANKVHIPAGSHDYADFQVALNMGAGARLRSSLDFRTGTYFDGRRTQVFVTPTWNASRHLELGGDYQLNALDFASRNEHVDIHLARLRVRAAMDSRKSGNAFLQYNSTTERFDLNLRLRYAFAEGTDLWIVYNEGIDTEIVPVSGVMEPRSLARAFIVKYTHTFGS